MVDGATKASLPFRIKKFGNQTYLEYEEQTPGVNGLTPYSFPADVRPGPQIIALMHTFWGLEESIGALQKERDEAIQAKSALEAEVKRLKNSVEGYKRAK